MSTSPISSADLPLAQAVVDAHHALDSAGQGDMIWGHVALRDPHGRGLWSKASGWGMNEVTLERVVLVSFEGEVIAGHGARHLETHIHSEIMRARPDVGASVHSHAIEAAAFASLDVPMRAVSHAATPFLDPVEEGIDVRRFTHTGDLIRTSELGALLAESLQGGNGCLIPAHGLVTVGEDVAAAVVHAVLLHNACRVQLLAESAGGPRRWSSPEEVSAKREGLWPLAALQAAYDHLVRTGGPGH